MRYDPPQDCAMQCATSPCRQGTASCGACVKKPKYPRAMRALAAGNSIPGASAPSGCWIAHAVAARHACHGSRDDGLCVDHGSPTCTPGSTRERSTSLRRPFIHAIEGHHLILGGRYNPLCKGGDYATIIPPCYPAQAATVPHAELRSPRFARGDV